MSEIYSGVKRGDVFYISRGGSEFSGSEQYPDRPGIVVSNNSANRHSSVLEVVYLTTKPKSNMPTHAKIYSTGKDSFAICEQIWSVDRNKFGSYICSLTEEEQEDVDKALLISLGLLDQKPQSLDEHHKKEVISLEMEITDLEQKLCDTDVIVEGLKKDLEFYKTLSDKMMQQVYGGEKL